MNLKNTFIFTLPSFIYLIIFSLFPTLIMIIFSFLKRNQYGNVKYIFTVENFYNLFSSSIIKAFIRSYLTAFLISFILVFLVLMFLLFLIDLKLSNKIILLLLFIPLVSNTLLRLYAINFLIRDTGIINNILIKYNVITNPLHLINNNKIVIFGYIYIYFPYMAIPIYSSINKYEPFLYIVSLDIGLNKIQSFFYIKLPIIRNGIYWGFVIVFLLILGDFIIPQILGGAKELYVSNVIFDSFTKSRNWPRGSAISVVTLFTGILFSSLLIMLIDKILLKKIKDF